MTCAMSEKPVFGRLAHRRGPTPACDERKAGIWALRSSMGAPMVVALNLADTGSSLGRHVRHHRHRQSTTDASDARR
jgi:hypothetical protein